MLLAAAAVLSLQAAVNDAVREAPESVAVVVMDVDTGAILAGHQRQVAERARATPGSTLKPFTLLALLEQGRKPAARVCNPKLRIDGRRLECSHPAPGSKLDAAQALAYSCNHWFAKTGLELDVPSWARTLRRLGLDADAIPMQENARSLLAIGEQGVTVTPMGLARAYRRLARLKRERRTEYAAVFDGLEQATEYGSARLASPEGGVRVAGKTGTTSNSSRTGTHAWFAGYGPAEYPEIVVVVFAEEGKGGATAAPIAGRVFEGLAPRRAALPSQFVTVRLWSRQKIENVTVDGVAVKKATKFEGAHRVSVNGARAVTLDGELAIRFANSGLATVTLRAPIEEYVAAAVTGESGSMPAESRRAGAVVIRTYAVKNRGRHRAQGYDYCDTTHCQDVRFSAISNAARQITRDTVGEVMWHEGTPATIYYSRHCGGHTEAGGNLWSGSRRSYLPSQTDPYCTRRSGAHWRVTLPAKDFAVLARFDSGRASKVRMDGRVLTLEQLQVATRFAIRSGFFEATKTAAGYLIEGRGDGHGVGLCHEGAAEQARQGRTWREILAFYFPGTEPGVSAGGLTWTELSGESVKLLTTQPAADGRTLAEAEAGAREMERRTGWKLPAGLKLRMFPTVAAFRNATGEPGWVAASTLGPIIRFQPAAVLRSRGVLASTILHELLHAAIEARAARGLPAWFREGLVLHLESPGKPGRNAPFNEGHISSPPSEAAMRVAYEGARGRVAALAERYGTAAVLGWVARGLPAEVAAIRKSGSSTASK